MPTRLRVRFALVLGAWLLLAAPITAQQVSPPALPTVLIHGFCSEPTTWNDTVALLRSLDGVRYGSSAPHVLYFDGSAVRSVGGATLESIGPSTRLFAIAFWNNGFRQLDVANVSIEEKGAQLQKVLEEIRIRTGYSKVILAGHSQGGLVARAYLQQRSFESYRDDVAGLVTIDTPHLGSPLANLQALGGFAGLLLQAGFPNIYQLLVTLVNFDCLSGMSVNNYQLQPGSDFLTLLNQQPAPAVPTYSISSWGSVQTEGDGVVPYSSQDLTTVYPDGVQNLDNQVAPSLWHRNIAPLLHTGIHAYEKTIDLVNVAVTQILRAWLPGRVESVTAEVRGNHVSIRWAVPSTGIPVVRYRLEGGRAPGGSEITADLPAGQQEVEYHSTPPGVYHFRVRAKSEAGSGPPSNEVTITVPSEAALPGAPSLLASRVEGTSVSLTWQPPSAGGVIESYVIEAGTAPGVTNRGTFTAIGTTYTGTGVPPGRYFLRVRGRNREGLGPASNETSFTIGLPPIGGPARPGLIATSDGNRLSARWSSGLGYPPTSYFVEVGTYAGASDVFAADVGLATSGSHVVPDGTYFVRVTAINRSGSATSQEFVVPVGRTGIASRLEIQLGPNPVRPTPCPSLMSPPCWIFSSRMAETGGANFTIEHWIHKRIDVAGVVFEELDAGRGGLMRLCGTPSTTYTGMIPANSLVCGGQQWASVRNGRPTSYYQLEIHGYDANGRRGIFRSPLLRLLSE